METTALAQHAAEIDFSLLALFARASFTVKLVMLMLTVASVWSWAIIVQKFITYRKARAEAQCSTRPSGRANRWTSCSKRSVPSRKAAANRSLPAAWSNGGGATGRTAR